MPAAETKTTNETAPWKNAQPALQGILNKAGSVGTKPFKPVQGRDTRAALNMAAGIAQQGSQALPHLQNIVGGAGQGFNSGLGELSSTVGGANLQGNPYMQSVLDRAARDTTNDVNQNFSAAGRYGSEQHAGTIADRVGALRQGAMMDNYNVERGNQVAAGNTLFGGGFQAGALAPQIDESRMFAPNVMAGVGAARDQYQVDRRQAPLRQAQWQAGMVNPIANMGQSQTQTQSTSNPMGTAAGILSTGLGLLSAIPTGGASLGAMGGGGGLLSLLGK